MLRRLLIIIRDYLGKVAEDGTWAFGDLQRGDDKASEDFKRRRRRSLYVYLRMDILSIFWLNLCFQEMHESILFLTVNYLYPSETYGSRKKEKCPHTQDTFLHIDPPKS